MEHSSAIEPQERKFARVCDTLLVSYSIGDDFAPEFTETYDIALGGMAMLTNAELGREEPINIQIELRGDQTPILRVLGIVRWSRYDPLLQRYRTGIAFLEVDDETNSFSAEGPVISVSRLSGGVTNVTPSPMASKWIVAFFFAGFVPRLPSAGSR